MRTDSSTFAVDETTSGKRRFSSDVEPSSSQFAAPSTRPTNGTASSSRVSPRRTASFTR